MYIIVNEGVFGFICTLNAVATDNGAVVPVAMSLIRMVDGMDKLPLDILTSIAS
jgi:hypothetical protein